MATTITLQNTINFASPFCDFLQLNIGSGNEPAFTIANTIIQTILGPPFKWNWNRKKSFFLAAPNAPPPTEFPTSPLSDFGFLEQASVTNITTNVTFAIKEIKNELTLGTDIGRPNSMAAMIDDNAGTITFFLNPAPDTSYTCFFYYQMKPPALFTSLSQTWAPIPDHYSYIYNYGFLALSLAYSDDARFPIFNQKFVAHLLGAQQGLSETERTMFLDSWNLISRQENLVALKSQQGRQALGT